MTEHRLHPFAALRVLRKTLVLYLVPLLRVLFERNWAALRAALRQLFAFIPIITGVILAVINHRFQLLPPAEKKQRVTLFSIV